MAKHEQREAARVQAREAVRAIDTPARRQDAPFSSSSFGKLSSTMNREVQVSSSVEAPPKKVRAKRKIFNDEARAVLRTMRISPQKLNLVAALIRGKKVVSALSDLEVSNTRVAGSVKKTLQAAVANAEKNYDLSVDALIVSEAYVGKSIVMKRFHARGRRIGQIDRPFSQLTIVVRESEDQDVADLKSA